MYSDLIFTLQVPLTLTSKAFNAAWNVQPENPNYNAHGCCVNHWYCCPVLAGNRLYSV